MFKLYKKSGRLTKISDNANGLRANGVLGYFHAPPTVSYNFRIYSDSLTPGLDGREVTTSEIISVESEDQKHIFRTRNSVYLLEIFEGLEEA